MEGRRPPPKASHPFPDYPDMTKFWNTPYTKPFFKSIAAMCLVYGTILGINLYLTRHQKGPFGQDLTMTREEALELQKLRAISSYIKHRFELQVDFNTDRARLLGGSSKLLFDDGVSFNPPKGLMKTDYDYAVPEEKQ